jgi:hypothetical protein
MMARIAVLRMFISLTSHVVGALLEHRRPPLSCQVRDKRTGQRRRAPCGRTLADTGMWDAVRGNYWVKNWCCNDCTSACPEAVPDSGARLLMLWALVEGARSTCETMS